MIQSLLLILCLAGVCAAQETKSSPPPSRYYKLDFSVKETEGGRVVNARSYSLSIVTPPEGGNLNGGVRTGEKIPFQTPTGPQQLDVGVNIDCSRAKEVGDRLGLNISAEISSVAESAEKTPLPVVRQTRMNTFVLVPLKKPTLIFSSDEPFSKGNLQIELTATPIN